MAATALCDQCGKRLTDEDFKNGRAFRDRADVFCAECAAMYAREEKARQKRTTAQIASPARARPSTGKARRRPSTHMRGAARAAGGTVRSTGVMRRPGPRNASPMIFLIVAAAVAVVAIAVIVVVVRSERTRPAPAPEQITITPVQPAQAPRQPQPQPTPQPAEGARGPRKPARSFGPSLLGPGGELDRPERN